MSEGVLTNSDPDGDDNAWVNGGYFPNQFHPIVHALLSVSALVQRYEVQVKWATILFSNLRGWGKMQ